VRNGLYPRLAAVNLKKNRQTWLPYLFTCIGTIMMFYIMLTLLSDPALTSMSGGTLLSTTLSFGSIIIAQFFSSVIPSSFTGPDSLYPSKQRKPPKVRGPFTNILPAIEPKRHIRASACCGGKRALYHRPLHRPFGFSRHPPLGILFFKGAPLQLPCFRGILRFWTIRFGPAICEPPSAIGQSRRFLFAGESFFLTLLPIPLRHYPPFQAGWKTAAHGPRQEGEREGRNPQGGGILAV